MSGAPDNQRFTTAVRLASDVSRFANPLTVRTRAQLAGSVGQTRVRSGSRVRSVNLTRGRERCRLLMEPPMWVWCADLRGSPIGATVGESSRDRLRG